MSRASSLEVENPELSRLKRGIGGQQLDDARRIGSLLQLGEDEHLVGVCVVDARLACSNTFPWYDDSLDAAQEHVVAVDTRRGRDDHTSRAQVDGDHRPRRKRGRWQQEGDRGGNKRTHRVDPHRYRRYGLTILANRAASASHSLISASTVF